MIAPLFLVAAAALWRQPVSGSSVASTTAATTELVCRDDAKSIDVEATFGVWRSVSTRVGSSSSFRECVVNVTMLRASARRQPDQPTQLLLLVKIEQLRLGSSPADAVFFVTMSHPTRRTNDYCSASNCSPSYLWASESVKLYLYIKRATVAQISYEASIVVAEATNVCDLKSLTGELQVESLEYVFAPDARHKQLPPNDANCARDVEYSLTVRPSVASANLDVKVLACPSNDSCWTMLLNGRSCSDVDRTIAQQLGSNVTLRYRRGLDCDYDTGYAGFIVIVTASATALSATALAIIVALLSSAFGIAAGYH